MSKKKKLEKRLNVRINQEQKKAILKREDIDRMDFEFITLDKEKYDEEEKFDIKVKSNDKFSLIIIIKFFSKLLNFSIKRDKKKETKDSNLDKE
ncbi:hypothetical protein CPT_Madawaska_274 [Staphylococcus phage Madawaska]|nr:hypothetical protein CPT_Madawaska_274 [Staphylococcus phage Madawaska]